MTRLSNRPVRVPCHWSRGPADPLVRGLRREEAVSIDLSDLDAHVAIA